MAKPKKPDDTPLEHHWVCEGCSTVNVGVDPPDLCRVCEGEYFESLADDNSDPDVCRPTKRTDRQDHRA